MTSLKKGLAAMIVGCSLLNFAAKAQQVTESVKQESVEWNNLRIRPGLSIYIPYVQLAETQLTGGVYTEASYDLEKLADVQASIHIGSFTGIAFGGTFHASDKMVSKSTKFKVASSTSGRIETTTFYRNNSEYRVVKGPTAAIRVGKFGDSGFYMRVDGGIDRQTHSRAYYRGYASNKNGFTSIKLLGTVAKFNQAEINSSSQEEYVSRIGAGALVSLFHERKPWKRITWHMGLDMGYMHILGAKDTKTQFVTFETNKANYILDMKAGLSIGI